MEIQLRGVYAVTPDCADGQALLSMVEAFARGGGHLLQYRNKSATLEEKRSQAAQLAEFCKLQAIRLIVNDDVELALEVGADGIHLGAGDGDLRKVRRRIGPHRLLGASCYDQLGRAAAAAEAGADYLAVGAVFPSATKAGAVLAPLALIGEVKRMTGLPVVAIGGIRTDNADAVVAAGADMIAVISDLFGASDIAAQTAAFQKLFE